MVKTIRDVLQIPSALAKFTYMDACTVSIPQT
jgi:hypothetical protein